MAPQYVTIDKPNPLAWLERAASSTGNIIYQLALMKAAHNMRLETADRELEVRKQDLKYKTEQDRLQAQSQARVSGVNVSAEPTGDPDEVFDEYLQGYVVRQKPKVYSYQGKNFVIDSRGVMHPADQPREARPDLKTYASPSGEIRTFDETKETPPPGWYPAYLDKRFKQQGGGAAQPHWQRKTRVFDKGGKKWAQEYDYNPLTREEKLSGEPYEAPAGFNFLEQLIGGQLPTQGPQALQPQQPAGMSPEEYNELMELRRRTGR